MNGVRSLSTSSQSRHFCHAAMVSTLKRFHCGFLKDTLSSTKDTSIDYYFFSLNFTSIEIEGERVSSSQKERTYGGRGGGGGGCSKTNKGKQGERGGGSKPGNLERTYFLNVPFLLMV